MGMLFIQKITASVTMRLIFIRQIPSHGIPGAYLAANCLPGKFMKGFLTGEDKKFCLNAPEI